MKSLILFINCILAFTLSSATSWEDPTWEEMIRGTEIIGLFEIAEGGIDDAIVSPIEILKGSLKTNITITGFNNNCASEEWRNRRGQKNGEKAYLFLHRWRGEYTVPTPSTGIHRRNEDDTVNYVTFGPTCFANLPSHPVEEFEEFIFNTVWVQENGAPNQARVEKLRLTIQEELAELNTNSLPDNLVYYRLWGGRDWIEGFESITNHPQPIARGHASELLGEMLPSAKAEALLLKLIDDPHSMVQGKAVSALMNAGDTNKTLTLLTKKLGSSAPGVIGPTNIMDPIMNTYLGGQLAIIREIKKHEYAAATNELVAVARNTRNSVVFRDAFRSLQTFDSPELSGLIGIQLKSEDPHVVDEAIRLSSDLPKPVKTNVREALEHVLLTADPDSYETSIIFKSLTSESLPALLPKINSILKQKPPKWWAEDYLHKAIELIEVSSPPEYHEMVDRILYYWTGVDSRALSSPHLLREKIELENHYARRLSRTQVINKKKYKTDTSAVVFIDFSKAGTSPNDDTPPHTFHVDLEMTVPANDPESPFEAIYASYDDNSITSPLLIWRREIAKETNIPMSNLGIFCHPSSGKGGNSHNTDKRLEYPVVVVGAYVDYAKRTNSEKAHQLINLIIKTGLAKHMECTDLFHRINE